MPVEDIRRGQVLRKLNIILRIQLGVEVEGQIIHVAHLIPKVRFKQISLYKNKHQARVAPALEQHLFQGLHDLFPLNVAQFLFDRRQHQVHVSRFIENKHASFEVIKRSQGVVLQPRDAVSGDVIRFVFAELA